MNRRDALRGSGALLAGSLAGCFTAGSPPDCGTVHPPEGFVLSNRDDAVHGVSVTITRELVVYSRRVFAERYELAPSGEEGASVTVPDPVRYAGPHVIEVDVESGASIDYLWKVTPDRCDPVRIVIRNGEITISEPTGP